MLAITILFSGYSVISFDLLRRQIQTVPLAIRVTFDQGIVLSF